MVAAEEREREENVGAEQYYSTSSGERHTLGVAKSKVHPHFASN